jgi:UrcA family protein
MTILINDERDGPIYRRRRFVLLIAAGLAMMAPDPASASFSLSFTRTELAGPDSRALVRRRAAAAARSLCDTGGLVGVFRDGNRRCRRLVVDDVERDVRARAAARFAAR